MIRVLGLGNEILSDDAFGIVAAQQIQQLFPGEVEVGCTSAAGFDLIDYILNASHLIVIDTVLTGAAEPGTVYTLREGEVETVAGDSPHRIGLFEALAVARKLDLPAPQEVTILVVEAADCTTLGGAMHPAVQAAMPVVIKRVQEILRLLGIEAR